MIIPTIKLQKISVIRILQNGNIKRWYVNKYMLWSYKTKHTGTQYIVSQLGHIISHITRTV